MTPLSFRGCLVAAIALCWIAMYVLYSKSSGRSERKIAANLSGHPNMLFVVLDDMGSNDLGMHGTGIHTPHMDALADSGVFLSNYYVLPACTPTRCALMSGRYPLHTGVNGIIVVGSTVGLPLDEETLPQVLARAGYQRHMVGKWHMGSARWEQMPTFRGFESFYGFVNGMEDYYLHSTAGAHDFRFDSRPNCGEGCSKVVDDRGEYSTHLYANAAIDVIQRHDASRGPLFLYLSFQAPHAPEVVPEQYERRYANRSWTAGRKTYAGMLTCADEAIGNVTAALKARGMWENTIVVGTTDNGGPTETCVVTSASNWPLRGGKCTLWEGGTRGDGFLSGPALARYGIQRGRNRNLFHVVDWLPTLAEMVGVQPQGKKLDGVSQLRSLARPGHPPAREEAYLGVIPWPVPVQGRAAVFRNWKIIEGNPGAGGGWVGPDGTVQRGWEIPPDWPAPWIQAAAVARSKTRAPAALNITRHLLESAKTHVDGIGGGEGQEGAEGVEERTERERVERELAAVQAELEEATERAGGGSEGGGLPWINDPGRWLLFDLSTDAEERVNLAASHPQQLAAMVALLYKYAATGVPQQREDPACKWRPQDWVVVEGLGPVWAPWCKHSSELVVSR